MTRGWPPNTAWMIPLIDNAKTCSRPDCKRNNGIGKYSVKYIAGCSWWWGNRQYFEGWSLIWGNLSTLEDVHYCGETISTLRDVQYCGRVFLTYWLLGHLPQWALLLAPVVKEKSVLWPQWPKSKWDPFSYDFSLVNKAMLLIFPSHAATMLDLIHLAVSTYQDGKLCVFR